MNAAGANHHYLIGVIVTEKTTGPKKNQVTTRDATSVVAWDIGVKANTADTMVLARSSSTWKRTLAPKVTYKYIGKAKSATSPAINTIGTETLTCPQPPPKVIGFFVFPLGRPSGIMRIFQLTVSVFIVTAKAYIEAYGTYKAADNNCLTFVTSVAASAQ